MQRKGLSQTELADKLGVTQAAISYWSSGKATPSLQVLKQLIFMGVTLEEIFDAETEAFLLKVKRTNKKKLAADVVETALASLVGGDGSVTDKNTCMQIVKIGLTELFTKKNE